jgi:hypothetical protein
MNLASDIPRIFRTRLSLFFLFIALTYRPAFLSLLLTHSAFPAKETWLSMLCVTIIMFRAFCTTRRLFAPQDETGLTITAGLAQHY